MSRKKEFTDRFNSIEDVRAILPHGNPALYLKELLEKDEDEAHTELVILESDCLIDVMQLPSRAFLKEKQLDRDVKSILDKQPKVDIDAKIEEALSELEDTIEGAKEELEKSLEFQLASKLPKALAQETAYAVKSELDKSLYGKVQATLAAIENDKPKKKIDKLKCLTNTILALLLCEGIYSNLDKIKSLLAGVL